MKSELYHYGIKGMHWGVRRFQNADGSYTAVGKARYATNYSAQQRTRDRKIYGKSAEKRINKRMLSGESIQSARHNEVVRKARIDSGKKITKTVVKGALVVGGSAAVYKLLQKKGLGDIQASQLSEVTVQVGRHVINALLR